MIQQILMTAFLFNSPSVAQQSPSFAGRWERDPEQSDDAEAKMQVARQAMSERIERRGGMPPGGPPGGGTPPGARKRGGRQPQMGTVPESLMAELEDNEFRIDDGERLQIFYLDGKKHKRQLPNGTDLETVSEMRGAAIHIEEKMRRGEMQRRYELSPDGQTMIMTLTLKMDGMKDPVAIRTVYQRIDEGPGS